ncbi:hypothetical protein LEMLEM_LOCUS20992 [Lemmus lemmus]
MVTALLCMLLQVTSCVALAECVIMEAKSLYGADLIFESPYKSDLISFINTHSHTHAEMERKMQKKRKKRKRKNLGEKHCSKILISECLNKQVVCLEQAGSLSPQKKLNSSAVHVAILHSIQCGSHCHRTATKVILP